MPARRHPGTIGTRSLSNTGSSIAIISNHSRNGCVAQAYDRIRHHPPQQLNGVHKESARCLQPRGPSSSDQLAISRGHAHHTPDVLIVKSIRRHSSNQDPSTIRLELQCMSHKMINIPHPTVLITQPTPHDGGLYLTRAAVGTTADLTPTTPRHRTAAHRPSVGARCVTAASQPDMLRACSL